MNITHMREFLTLIEHNSYASAAKKLYISQPTLSRHVNALESEIGEQLLNRSQRSISLTEGGQVAVTAFRTILKTVDDLADTVSVKAS